MRNNIQDMNFQSSNEKNAMNGWTKNTFGVEIQAISYREAKNGLYGARFNSLDNNLQFMLNKKRREIRRKKS